MLRTSAILWSTTAISLAFIATTATAQTQAAPDPTVQAQEQPAEPETGSSTSDAAAQSPDGQDQSGDAIVVTGLRKSLQSAQNIKRNSTQIVDAIVAEDIGKLPDITVSDTAARIPGFQIERERGEGSRVLLRGLDENYYTTTYNGREIFTAERRQVALQDFPAGGIAAIEAFKTSSANLVEPGLTGLVNVRSRRPFDFNGLEIAGSIWVIIRIESAISNPAPNCSLAIAGKWATATSAICSTRPCPNFTIRISYAARLLRPNLAGARSPDWPEIHYNEGDRQRPSINGAIQWRSGNGLEFTRRVCGRPIATN